MTRLFARNVQINAGLPGLFGQRWDEDYDISFEVTKTRRRSSNKAVIKIWGLNDASIGLLNQVGTAVSVLAGYPGNRALIFEGDIAKRGITTEDDGKERVTTIEAGASEKAIQTTRTDFSLAAPTNSALVLALIVAKMGIGPGNIATLPPKQYLTGYCHTGKASAALDEIADDLGVKWSIQNGQLQMLLPGVPTLDTAVLLTPDSGLIGSPTKQKDGVAGKSLLQPDIIPGRLLSIVSLGLTGFFKISEVTHRGETFGGDFTTEFKGKTAGST
ncbi:MAG: hypothetical protein KAI73_12430 [Rhodospirillaceae bacterium]|nr:hypothetical protein [Rhodospirillaceae bacterium]